MKHHQLRFALLTSLGLAPIGCGGNTAGAPESTGDKSGPPTCTSTQSDAASGLVFCDEGYSHRSTATTCAGSVCNTDLDCGDGYICACGGGVAGACKVSECRTNDDCEDGYHCANVDLGGFMPTATSAAFACQSPADRCAGSHDCAEGQSCQWNEVTATRSCEPICTGCGRPFLVAKQARVAPVVMRADWLLS